jgi:hypothetical protein
MEKRGRFSARHKSFNHWKAHVKNNSRYYKRITRLHDYFPKESLKVLREKRLSDLDLSKKRWNLLTAKQKHKRILALEILRQMRKGESLSSACEEIGLAQSETLIYLGKVIRKRSGRWIANKTDSIQRALQIYEKGRIITIVVNKSKYASLIGSYYNAVKNYLLTGDSSYLTPFKDKIIIDIYRKRHRLETNPDNVRDIEESKEDSEVYEVYSDE